MNKDTKIVKVVCIAIITITTILLIGIVGGYELNSINDAAFIITSFINAVAMASGYGIYFKMVNIEEGREYGTRKNF